MLLVTLHLAKWHTCQCQDSSKAYHKGQRVGSAPIPGNPHSFPKLAGILLPLLAKLLQSCPALCDPMDCRPPGSSVHGILQARKLEWVTIPFSRGSSQLRDQTQYTSLTSVSLAGVFFTTSPPWEAYEITKLYKNWQPHTLGLLLPSEMAHTVCGMCFSLNKCTSYLSICLSLTSSCNETSRTWDGVCDLSWRSWVQVPVWVTCFTFTVVNRDHKQDGFDGFCEQLKWIRGPEGGLRNLPNYIRSSLLFAHQPGGNSSLHPWARLAT